MKKTILITLLLCTLLIAADQPTKLFKLTIINKAEVPIAIRLMGSEDEDHLYYLPVAEGSRDVPTIRTFQIAGDEYYMQVYYIQTYDPVYGWKCQQPAPNKLLAARNQKVVVLPCDQLPGNVGEPSMRKYLPYPVFPLFKWYGLFRYIY